MKLTSTRTLDNKSERIVSSFLANHYYSVLKANGSIAGFETITDPALQRRGVDFIVTNTDGTKTNVDLKAAVAYINEHLPTQAFELSSLFGGKVVQGWLFNNRLETDRYLIATNITGRPIGDKVKYGYVDAMQHTDLRSIDVFEVPRQRLICYLDSLGLTRDVLEGYSRTMREHNILDKDLTDGIKIKFSPHLAERPVNLVIRKSILLKLADSAYTVTRTSMRPLAYKNGKEQINGHQNS